MRSADGSPPLFAHFAGTMQSLDSPPPCMEDLWLIAFSSRPAYFHGRRRGLPVLAHGVSLHAWGLRLRGAAPRSRYRECALLPSVRADAVGSPEPLISELNTQPTDTPWAKPPSRAVCRNKRLPPCPTLQVRRYRRPRMARGQSGSLRLLCTTLSFATPCRFIPALSSPKGLTPRFAARAKFGRKM